MTREELIDLEVAFTDEWFKNHKERPTYADAIEWEHKRIIEKACNSLVHNMTDSVYLGANTLLSFRKAEFIERFKTAIEE